MSSCSYFKILKVDVSHCFPLFPTTTWAVSHSNHVIRIRLGYFVIGEGATERHKGPVFPLFHPVSGVLQASGGQNLAGNWGKYIDHYRPI